MSNKHSLSLPKRVSVSVLPYGNSRHKIGPQIHESSVHHGGRMWHCVNVGTAYILQATSHNQQPRTRYLSGYNLSRAPSCNLHCNRGVSFLPRSNPATRNTRSSTWHVVAGTGYNSQPKARPLRGNGHGGPTVKTDWGA